MLPELTASLAVEGVDACFCSGAGINIRGGDDPIRCDEHVAVEEILRRLAPDVRFPLNLAGFDLELAEETVARAYVKAVARDRGRVRESPSGFKPPKDLGFVGLCVRCWN